MNTTPTLSQTAFDELLRRNPAIDPELLTQVQQATALLRQLGLLSTEPTEAIRPFGRRCRETAERPKFSNWPSTARNIQLNKLG
ncbi:MAG: hypothetical protein JNM56_30845 [Planctomycetia bacterium]|nr:hypothetical protein [Planctomycetia bacterium]